METRKIALACFIGGTIGATVALLVTPLYWYIGLLAGFAGGYFSFEFRSVVKEIPEILMSVFSLAIEVTVAIFSIVYTGFQIWFSKPRLFSNAAAVLVTLSWVLLILSTEEGTRFKKQLLSDFSGRSLLGALVFYVFSALLCLIFSFLFVKLAQCFAILGSRKGERCYFLPLLFQEGVLETMHEVRELQSKGYVEKSLTFWNGVRWFFMGVAISIQYTCWKIPLYFIIGIFKFNFRLVKVIHSNKRLLCGVDGMLGGAISYLYLVEGATTLSARIVLVLFGGILGAAFGVLNWEIVSKRILRVAPATT